MTKAFGANASSLVMFTLFKILQTALHYLIIAIMRILLYNIILSALKAIEMGWRASEQKVEWLTECLDGWIPLRLL